MKSRREKRKQTGAAVTTPKDRTAVTAVTDAKKPTTALTVGKNDAKLNAKKSQKAVEKAKSPDIEVGDESPTSDDGSGSEDEEYVVERILDVRGSRSGSKQYLVQWRGYSDDDSTWEPAANLTNCSQLLREFEETRAAKFGVTSGMNRNVASQNPSKRMKTVDVLDELEVSEEAAEPPALKKRRVTKQKKEMSETSEVDRGRRSARTVGALTTPLSHSKKKKRHRLSAIYDGHKENTFDDVKVEETPTPADKAPVGNRYKDRQRNSKKSNRSRVSTTTAAKKTGEKRNKSDRSRAPAKTVATNEEEDEDEDEDDGDEDDRDEDDGDQDEALGIPKKILCATRSFIGKGLKKQCVVQYAVEIENPRGKAKKAKHEIWRSSTVFAVAPQLLVDYWEQSAYWPKQQRDADVFLGGYNREEEEEEEDPENVGMDGMDDQEVLQQHAEHTNGAAEDHSDYAGDDGHESDHTEGFGTAIDSDSAGEDAAEVNANGDSEDANKEVEIDVVGNAQEAENGSGSDQDHDDGISSGGSKSGQEDPQEEERNEASKEKVTLVSVD